MLQQLDVSKREPQGLILVPTRELADQVTSVVNDLSAYMGLKVHGCMGGTNIQQGIQKLRGGVHVIVGTPGRVADMISRGHINLTTIKVFILDEADEMLSVGFRPQIQEIFTQLNENVQCGIFSATFPPEALSFTEKLLRDPTKIIVPKEELTLKGIAQYYVNAEHVEYKLDVLCEVLEVVQWTQCVIFCNSKRGVEVLAKQMADRDFPVSVTHGAMTSKERIQIIADFRRGKTRVLLSTDLLARGVDIQGVGLVFNFDLPRDQSNYIHRIGRGGRFGRKGIAISLVTNKDAWVIEDLEKYYKTSIPALPADLSGL